MPRVPTPRAPRRSSAFCEAVIADAAALRAELGARVLQTPPLLERTKRERGARNATSTSAPRPTTDREHARTAPKIRSQMLERRASARSCGRVHRANSANSQFTQRICWEQAHVTGQSLTQPGAPACLMCASEPPRRRQPARSRGGSWGRVVRHAPRVYSARRRDADILANRCARTAATHTASVASARNGRRDRGRRARVPRPRTGVWQLRNA